MEKEKRVLITKNKSTNMKGIDVSPFQRRIDWGKVKAAGIDFVIIKVSEGIRYSYITAAIQAEGAKAAGLKIGYYHYGCPHLEDHTPEAEADYFLAAIKTYKLPTADIIPAIDVEQSFVNGIEKPVRSGLLYDWLKRFIARMRVMGNPNVMIYSNAAFLNSHLPADHILGSSPLWLSQYSPKITIKAKGWAYESIWQYSGSGRVDGISGNVDTNLATNLPLITP